MAKLTVGALKEILKEFPDDLPIFLGDDEELNNIHYAFFAQKYSATEAKKASYGAIEEAGFLIS